MPNHPSELQLPESEARRLLLAQALDESDTAARLIGASERDEVERAALAASGDPARGQPMQPRKFLLERARRLLELLGHRQPAVAALQEPPPWQALLGWLLPVLALLAGALIDRIDNPHQVNLLSPPLLAFLLWNLVVYVTLVVLAVRPPRGPAALQGLWRGRHWPGRRRPAVVQAFARLWGHAGAALEGQRWRRILHVAAVAWGVGVALSIVLGGLVREYRVGWESTLLDVPQVHAFLQALFAPVVALLPVQGFSVEEVSRLHFGSGADVGRTEARRWVGLYVALLALVVVAPRSLLAAWAWWRESRLAAAVRIDLAQPYYEDLLGRVQPARIRLGLLPSGAEAEAVVQAILRQLADAPPPTSPQLPWVLAATARGDELQLLRESSPVPPRGAADEPGAAPARSWWQRWAPAAVEPASVPPPVLAAHALVAVTDEPQDLERAMPSLRASGRPVLVLAGGGADAAYDALLQGLSHAACVVSLHALPNWHADGRLFDALAALLPVHQHGGLDRLRAAWDERARARLAAATRLLAQELVDAAMDHEPLAAIGLRQLVVPAERDAGREAREQARAALLQRLQDRRQATDLQLHEWHGGGAEALQPEAVPAIEWSAQPKLDARQAGLAGAASGAAMGATLDLMTGVMTLGAASALGGLIGGGAAVAAAAWRNTTGQGNAQGVALSDDMLLALSEAAVLRYLAAAHAGRRVPQDRRERWPAAVRQALQQRRSALGEAWSIARQPEGAEQAAAALAPILADAVLPLL